LKKTGLKYRAKQTFFKPDEANKKAMRPRTAFCFVSIAVLVALLSPTYAGIVNSCGTLLSSSTLSSDVILDSNITATCFSIESDNVVLDCEGHSLTKSANCTAGGGTTFGVWIDSRTNVTVRNCTIFGFSRGIQLDSTSGVNITNNTLINNTERGITVHSSRENTVHHNSFSNCSKCLLLQYSADNFFDYNVFANCSTSAAYLEFSSNNNSFSNSVINLGNTSTAGVSITQSSSNNTFRNNTVCGENESACAWSLELDSRENKVLDFNETTEIRTSCIAKIESRSTLAFINSSINSSRLVFPDSTGNATTDQPVRVNATYYVNGTAIENALVRITDAHGLAAPVDGVTLPDGATDWLFVPELLVNSSGILELAPHSVNVTAGAGSYASSRRIKTAPGSWAGTTINAQLFHSVSSCGMTINEDSILTSDLACSGATGVTLGADNITLDCDWSVLTGDFTPDKYGIYLSGINGTIIQNCSIKNFRHGIYVSSSSNNTFQNIASHHNIQHGANVVSSQRNVFEDSAFYNNSESGVNFHSSFHNIVRNSSMNDNTQNGLHFRQGSKYNDIYDSVSLNSVIHDVYSEENSSLNRLINCTFNESRIRFDSAPDESNVTLAYRLFVLAANVFHAPVANSSVFCTENQTGEKVIFVNGTSNGIESAILVAKTMNRTETINRTYNLTVSGGNLTNSTTLGNITTDLNVTLALGSARITSPVNGTTYTASNVPLSYDIFGASTVNSSWYSLDDGVSNVTFAGTGIADLGISSNGDYTLTLWLNDSEGRSLTLGPVSFARDYHSSQQEHDDGSGGGGGFILIRPQASPATVTLFDSAISSLSLGWGESRTIRFKAINPNNNTYINVSVAANWSAAVPPSCVTISCTPSLGETLSISPLSETEVSCSVSVSNGDDECDAEFQIVLKNQSGMVSTIISSIRVHAGTSNPDAGAGAGNETLLALSDRIESLLRELTETIQSLPANNESLRDAGWTLMEKLDSGILELRLATLREGRIATDSEIMELEASMDLAQEFIDKANAIAAMAGRKLDDKTKDATKAAIGERNVSANGTNAGFKAGMPFTIREAGLAVIAVIIIASITFAILSVRKSREL